MQWRTHPAKRYRTRVAFAWLPVRCMDGQTRWLERVLVHEVYLTDWKDEGWWQRSGFSAL
jgi:hypothetical protein